MSISDAERYMKAAHTMQTCVAIGMQGGDRDTTPKHLRVGINSSMVTEKAIATLLIGKGVFTKEEYVKAIADAMEDEVKEYCETLGIKPENVG